MEEASAAKPVQEPAKAVAVDAGKATAQNIAAELKEIRDPGPPVDPHVLVDGKKAVALLKAANELKEVEKAARKKSAKIHEARQTVEPKAYLLETISRPVDEDVAAKNHKIAGWDFDDFEAPAGGYDRVIMHPPFSDGRDADHVRRAYDMLKPGGRLVAITGEGIHFRQDKKTTAFRDWIEARRHDGKAAGRAVQARFGQPG